MVWLKGSMMRSALQQLVEIKVQQDGPTIEREKDRERERPTNLF